jgi:hypothetical protein
MLLDLLQNSNCSSSLGEEQRHMNMKVHIIAKANSQGNIKKEIYTRTK